MFYLRLLILFIKFSKGTAGIIFIDYST